MTKYYYETIDGKICGLNEKQIAVLTNSLWDAIKSNRIMLSRFPDGISDYDLINGRSSYDYAVYMHGVNDSDKDIVIRYYATLTEDGCFSTTPIELSYSTFINDLLTYGDTLNIEDAKTNEVLKSFSIRMGA